MSLYRRHYRPHLGELPAIGIPATGEGLSRLLADNPFSTHYVPPAVSPKPEAVVAYWMSILKRQYGRNLPLPRLAAMAHAKQALQKHTTAEIIKAIRVASFLCQNPFSIPFAVQALYGGTPEPASQPVQLTLSALLH